MKLSEYKYNLPKNLVAKFPVDPRDTSNLMILDSETGEIEEMVFNDIVNLFQKGDCIVLNETKVFPARIFGKKEKTNAKIEVILLRELIADEKFWDVQVEPARMVRQLTKIYFDGMKFFCEVQDNTTARGRTVKFTYDGDIFDVIQRHGEMALPEYIKREPTEFDKESYQCVFANPDRMASVAPPTAGLHFTNEIIQALEDKGVRVAKILLNIGYGSFDKIEVEDLTKHRMHSEYFEINRETAEKINKTLKAKKNVYAIGSSTLRALESSVLTSGAVKPNKGWTDKFIFTPYRFKIANRFLTNFHQPASPTLLLSSAFAGHENLMKAYKRAIKNNYRFHCYGDALLIK